MDWIFDNFQIVILILLGIGSMIKSMFDAKARQDSEQQPEWDPEDEVPLDEDTSYRKPTPSGPPPHEHTTAVPPPLPRQATPPPLRMPGYDAEVAHQTAKALKHQQDLAARLLQIRESKAATTGGASATRARIAAKGAAKPFKPVPLTLRGRLRNPAEVRQAIVMREILGPPVGLR